MNDQYDDEIDLRELFMVLWAGKIKIIVITAVFAVASVVYALSVPNQYKATALLAPAQSSGGGLSGALGQLGGLASLAGVSIGGGESSEAQIAQEIMKSWNFIEGFIADNDLAVELFAAEGWSKGSNTLKINGDDYDVEKSEWLIEDDDTGELRPPSSWSLFKAFSERLAVSEDKKSGLVSVSIEYYSPQIAKQWLDMYVSAVNAHMQKREVAEVTNNINYLQAQIEKTSIAEMREVFYTIIEEQTKNKMVAEASPEYAFVAVSPSMVPEEKSQPKRALICILGTLLGGMLSVLLVLIMHYARKSD
jgi:LPS O-antigen subunit length determinant protein (WzzB/FepE family)